MRLTKQEGRNRINDGLARIKRVKERYGFLEKHSRILVGISGGVDSCVLLALLHEYNERFTQGWHIHACHVHMSIPGYTRAFIERFLTSFPYDYTIVKDRIPTSSSGKMSTCYLCARQRRKRLLEVAESMNIQQIALAHHKQDIAETLLLNMMYNGETSTLTPKQSVIQGRHFFIRPLYEYEKTEITTIAALYSIPSVKAECPHFKKSKRNNVRSFLERCRKDNPDLYKNIFRAVTHIKRTYLP